MLNPNASASSPTDTASLEAASVAVSPRLRILPHEWVFNGFLFLVWARLVTRGHVTSAAAWAFLGFLIASALVIAWAARRPTPWRWRLRLLWYPSLMGLSFYTLPFAIPLLGAKKADARLDSWDHLLLGQNLSQTMERWSTPLLTDLMMLAYLFYFYYLIAGPGRYCVRDLPRFRQCIVGLFVVMGLGYFCYTLLPARGPYSVLPFDGPLPAGWLTRWAQPIVDAGSNGVDVFPSLHLAVSLYILIFDWRYARKLFWWMLGPCLALWVSTVYLRYHYVVDLLAGTALAFIGVWADRRYARSKLAQAVDRETTTTAC